MHKKKGDVANDIPLPRLIEFATTVKNNTQRCLNIQQRPDTQHIR